jgi:hypothetical protein
LAYPEAIENEIIPEEHLGERLADIHLVIEEK